MKYVVYYAMKKNKSTEKTAVARQNCANWNSGLCLGVIIYHKDGKLTQSIRKSMYGKKCFAASDCDYFENIVLPGVK